MGGGRSSWKEVGLTWGEELVEEGGGAGLTRSDRRRRRRGGSW